MTGSKIEAKITGVQLKPEKDNETGEIFPVMVFKGESQVANTNQVLGLFDGFRQQLVTVKITPFDSSDGDFHLGGVTIETFNLKNKKVRIGHGKETEYENVDYIFFTMRVKTDAEGECLKRLHGVFQQSVEMVIE